MTKIVKNDGGNTCDNCGEQPDFLALFNAPFSPFVCALCYDCLFEAGAMIEVRQMNATAAGDEERSGITKIPN